jgi:AraC-like DNA-binding protein
LTLPPNSVGEPTEDEKFRASGPHAGKPQRSRRAVFGSVTLDSYTLPPGRVLLPAPNERFDSLRLHVVERGEIAIRDTSINQSPLLHVSEGSALLMIDPLRVEAHAGDGSAVLTVSAPTALADGVMMHPGDGTRVIPRTAPLLRPTTAFFREASRMTSDLSSFNHYFFEKLLQEMILALAVDVVGLTPSVRATDHVAAAMAIIAAQRSDPALRASGVARELNLSLRQLERLFQAKGTTVGVEIRRARVEYAAALLVAPEYKTLTVDQVARYAGFSNGSSLARAMASQGYSRPTSLRERPRSAL